MLEHYLVITVSFEDCAPLYRGVSWISRIGMALPPCRDDVGVFRYIIPGYVTVTYNSRGPSVQER